ncbi:MAG: hypothetical protein RLZZ241_1019 [Bacteroidota bacterium]
MMTNSKITLKGLVYALFAVLAVWIGFKLWDFDAAGNGFILGDWLVNYQDGGFKRRGLSGSILFWLQDLTGISLTQMIYGIQMLLHLSILYFIFKTLKNKQISLLFFTLIISPLAFLMYFNDPAIVGRKELIFICIFTYYITQLYQKKLTLNKEIFIYSALVIATFLHEITVFYVPYFVLAHYIIVGELDLKRYFLFFAAVGIPAALIFFLGGQTNEGQTLEILLSRGVELEPYSIFSFSNDLWVQFDKYKANMLGYALFVPSMIIGLVHFGIYLRQEAQLKDAKVIWYFLAIILYSLPLFVLACDWGRWLNIHFTLLLFILMIKLPEIHQEQKKSKAIIPFLGRNLQYFLLILFLGIWSVRHFSAGLSYRGVITTAIWNLYDIILG